MDEITDRIFLGVPCCLQWFLFTAEEVCCSGTIFVSEFFPVKTQDSLYFSCSFLDAGAVFRVPAFPAGRCHIPFLDVPGGLPSGIDPWHGRGTFPAVFMFRTGGFSGAELAASSHCIPESLVFCQYCLGSLGCVSFRGLACCRAFAVFQHIGRCNPVGFLVAPGRGRAGPIPAGTGAGWLWGLFCDLSTFGEFIDLLERVRTGLHVGFDQCL